jgi:zinc transport system substrate-binding protein
MAMTSSLFKLPRCLLISCFLFASAQAGAEQPLNVYTVNYPLQFFVEAIGGQAVQATYPGPADTDPAFWRPDIESLQRYQSADLVVLNGAEYAKWLKTVSLPRLRLVNSTEGLGERLLRADAGPTHSHGPQGDHSHGGIAFTTWLDFELAALQAARVRDGLVRKRPHLKDVLDKNYLELFNELNALDERMLEIRSGYGSKPLFASHPVYQYLAQAYGLNITSFFLEPDLMPDEAAWKQIEEARAHSQARLMIWEATPDPAIAERLRRVGIQTVVFDPGATPPAQGDFLDLMSANVSALAVAIDALAQDQNAAELD